MPLQRLYSKYRADLSASLATGGGSAALLYVLEAADLLATEPEAKAAAATLAGWAGGKVAGYLTNERHPAGPYQLAAPAPEPPGPDGR